MLRRVSAAIALIALPWSVLIWLSGGLVFSIAGVRISSSDPLRPLIVAGVALGFYIAASGLAQLRLDAEAVGRRVTRARLAALLTFVTLAVGITQNSWSAGGPDSYAYVSQADLWLQGKLKVAVPMAGVAPWPNAIATFTPFGYSAVTNENAIAPVTGPGLPMLMAAFKYVGGHAAAFLVVPLSGALLVWAAFLIGRTTRIRQCRAR